MALLSDLRIIGHMLIGARGGDHAGRLEAFYAGQADSYDDFRRRLLHGREAMIESLDVRPGMTLLDLGGGTGHNLEAFGDRLKLFERVEIVDLSPSLLRIAQRRIDKHGWANVRTVEADATTYTPPGGPADVVTFSYSLTMIPDWIGAVDRALTNLKPGGQLGVVDYSVSRKWPPPGLRKHTAFQRLFWPLWFGHDNVFLSPEHLPYLLARTEAALCQESLGNVPYLLGLKAPYYVYRGVKR